MLCYDAYKGFFFLSQICSHDDKFVGLFFNCNDITILEL